MRSPLLATLSLLVLTGLAPAQVKAPPPPGTYRVDIRYEIDAFRNERARQFLDMMKILRDLGFRRDRDDEARGEELDETVNREANRLRGTLPSASLGKLLAEPHIVTVLASPDGVALPDKAQPVRVDLRLIEGVNNPDRQRSLAREVVAVLEALGFKEAVGYDHRVHTRVLGTIPAGQLETLLTDLRRTPGGLSLLPPTLLTEVRAYRDGAALLQLELPGWYKTAEGKKVIAPILVDWRKEEPARRFLSNLPDEVLRLRDVVDEELYELMLRHPDSGPYLTRLMAGVLKSPAASDLVEPLLRRLRGRAAAALLPPLFRTRTTVRVVEARPDLPLPSARPAEVRVPDDQRKLSDEVIALLKDQAQATVVRRLEILLSETPGDDDGAWERQLYRVAPDLQIEGRVGPVVAARLSPRSAQALTPLTLVSTIRLPVAARSTVLTLADDTTRPADALKAVGLTKLHDKGHRGKKVRIGVIDSDFRGWQGEVGKRLPAQTRLVDLTAERSVDFQPDAFPGDPKQLGSGTQMAVAAMLAAPEAELTLIRVDAAAPHLVALAARRIAGDRHETESLRRRVAELNAERDILKDRRRDLNAERRAVFDDFPDNIPQTDPIIKERQRRREEYEKKEVEYARDEAAVDARISRLLAYRTALEGLADVKVAVSGLIWNDGHPVNGTSGLVEALDKLTEADRLWFQPTGPMPGQVWSGFHQDPDNNGRMNFLPEGGTIAAGTWNAEMNFLGWQPLEGPRSEDIPAGTRVRVSLQWTESQDGEFARQGGDPFRQPLARLRLVALKQFDPAGAKRPSDDLGVVAVSRALPQRLRQDSTSATYEHSVEFTTEAGARYVIHIEGEPPQGTAPASYPALPLGRRVGELRPRLLVEAAGVGAGPVLLSYATDAGSPGTPADALRVLTVGAADGEGKARSYSGRGTPHLMELLQRPEVLAPDRLGLGTAGGTGIAAAFSAGWAASRLSGGHKPENLGCPLRETPGRLLSTP